MLRIVVNHRGKGFPGHLYLAVPDQIGRIPVNVDKLSLPVNYRESDRTIII
jgi:hypothetical protein